MTEKIPVGSGVDIIDDSYLISSALDGIFKSKRNGYKGRSRTKQGYRGKESSIKECYTGKCFESLSVISKRGHVDLIEGNKSLSNDFAGTMISWKVTAQSLIGGYDEENKN